MCIKCETLVDGNWLDFCSDVDEAGASDEKEEKKRQRRGGKAAHKTIQAKKAPQRITVSKAPRGKRKMVTVVTGLATFGM